MKKYLPLTSPTKWAVLAALISGGEGFAAVSLISQTRTVDAQAESQALLVVDSPAPESKSAPGFGLFTESVEPFALAISSGSLVAAAQGVAKQKSSLSTSLFAAEGEASISLSLFPPAVGLSGDASGKSFFEVFFSVDEAMHFSLSGFVDTQGIVTGDSGLPALENEVGLKRTDDNTLIFLSGSNDGSLLAAGELIPGNYRLWAQAEVSASQISSSVDPRTVSGISEFDFRMLVYGVPETSTYVSALGLVGLAAMFGVRWGRR